MTPIRPTFVTRLEQIPEPIRVLYLDDDPSEAEILETQLAAGTVNPVIFFTQAQALYDYLDAHEGPFIILVDLVLMNHPGFGGGYEVISTLTARQDVIDTLTPVIAITG